MRHSHRALLLLALLVFVTLPAITPHADARNKPGPEAPAVLTRKLVGISTAGAPAGNELVMLAAQLGRTPHEIMWFVAWGSQASFPTEDVTRVRSLGATPVITWEPWDPAAGTTQNTYSMSSIAAGQHDSYIRGWARAARAFGTPLVIRFAHEMNGNWYPWSPGIAGTTPQDVVFAWRRVRDLFRREKATNVLFRWAPNVPYPGSAPLAHLWPGTTYVDQLGLDGYNWAGHLPGTSWVAFDDLFAGGLAELGSLSQLPVHVSEAATPETTPQGIGDKPAWITQMFASLRTNPRLAGVTWFSHAKELDWRIDSTPAARDAFASSWAALPW